MIPDVQYHNFYYDHRRTRHEKEYKRRVFTFKLKYSFVILQIYIIFLLQVIAYFTTYWSTSSEFHEDFHEYGLDRHNGILIKCIVYPTRVAEHVCDVDTLVDPPLPEKDGIEIYLLFAMAFCPALNLLVGTIFTFKFITTLLDLKRPVPKFKWC